MKLALRKLLNYTITVIWSKRSGYKIKDLHSSGFKRFTVQGRDHITIILPRDIQSNRVIKVVDGYDYNLYPNLEALGHKLGHNSTCYPLRSL